ncbi:MAG: aminopeptidase P family N-terminal domain-containing protein, partial [Pseudomonadota bacterium]
MPANKPITKIKNKLKDHDIDGFIIPLTDQFLSEYIAEYDNRLKWVTNFTGSAGVAVILEKKAAFFTDGRYTIQAKNEINLRD